MLIMRQTRRWSKLRMRRYRVAKSVILCSVISVYLVNIVLRTEDFLSYYCEEECNLKLWATPYPPEDNQIISYISQHVLDPPQKEVIEGLTSSDLDNQSWRLLGHWHLIQEVIRTTLGDLHNGVFVEIGAGDGVFLSHTTWLEAERNWTGLLVEPRSRSYEALRRRRKAMAAQVCVSDEAFNHKDMLWQPKDTETMPYMYRRVTEGKATLYRYVAEEDRPLGEISTVQCFTLDALLAAAGLSQKKRIDLLVVHTMGGEGKILDTLENADILFLAIRDRGGIDRRDIVYASERLNLTPYEDIPKEIDNFKFFLTRNVVMKEKPEEAAV